MDAAHIQSTRPYLIRAIYEWCTDQGFTPYLAVHVDSRVQVPTEHVSNNEIVLNISFDATSGLKLGNDWIEFKARFSGVARDILVPVVNVMAIYARENGQGMAFPLAQETDRVSADETVLSGEDESRSLDKVVKLVPAEQASADSDPEQPQPPRGGGKPVLKRVK